MKSYRTLAIAGAVSTLIFAAASASAGSNRLNVPASEWLSHAEVIAKLSAQGYTVREIEADDGVYEVEMTDKNGVRIESHVHPATGKILHGYDD